MWGIIPAAAFSCVLCRPRRPILSRDRPMRPALRLAALLPLILAAPAVARAQGTVSHLTVYDVGVAQVLEERTVQLQPGTNHIDWRSLMPRAFIRTLRVTAEGAEVARQEVSYDGTEVRNTRSPALRLEVTNRGGARAARVRVDYMAPGVGWNADYSLVLAATGQDQPPTAGTLDAWVSLLNETGTDVRAGTVDLVAGEIALLVGGGQNRQEAFAMNVSQSLGARGDADGGTGGLTTAGAGGVGAFHRFRLGRDVALNTNAPVGRHPLFQGARLELVQRNVFENEFGVQTLARGGFQLLPRGLDVRLVSRNPTDAAMPAGQVTVYATQGGVAQVVGQDRVPLTPAGGEFSVALGRSGTIFGTRRVLERREVEYRTEDGRNRDRLITRVEVVLTNRGAAPAEAFVRESVEPNGENQWTVTESSARFERLSANTFQMRVQVPARGSTTVTYTVETK